MHDHPGSMSRKLVVTLDGSMSALIPLVQLPFEFVGLGARGLELLILAAKFSRCRRHRTSDQFQ